MPCAATADYGKSTFKEQPVSHGRRERDRHPPRNDSCRARGSGAWGVTHIEVDSWYLA